MNNLLNKMSKTLHDINEHSIMNTVVRQTYEAIEKAIAASGKKKSNITQESISKFVLLHLEKYKIKGKKAHSILNEVLGLMFSNSNHESKSEDPKAPLNKKPRKSVFGEIKKLTN